MSKELSKEEFLKRYLENSSKNRKRKEKPKEQLAKVSRLKIIDENIDLKSIKFGDKAGDEDNEDEAPVVAEVIDERPLEVKVKELFGSSCWKKINHDENSQSDTSLGGRISADGSRDFDSSTTVKSSKNCHSHLKRTRHDSDGDISPTRHKKDTVRPRHDSDSDRSPPREANERYKRHDSDKDISPPRNISSNYSKKLDSRWHSSDSDISPHYRKDNSNEVPKRSFVKNDSDSERNYKHNHHKKLKLSRDSKNRKDSDSDLSPPRPTSSKLSVEANNKRPKKTLSGLKAGLQDSETLRQETQELRKREKIEINMLDDIVSGRNAETVVRDRKTGLRRDLDQEKQLKDEKNKKAEEHQKKYEKWGKGIEQTKNKMDKFEEDLHEMSKPLARYQDDADLDERLRSVIHDDDPMLEYIKKKKQRDVPTVPVYSGPPAPPNRFNIMPGYRWDGVDRSNGFEKRYFEKLNSTKAVQEEAYLWSVQNM